MDIMTILVIVLAIVTLVLLCSMVFLIISHFQSKRKQQELIDEENTEYKSTVQQNYSAQSIFKFMEFEKIEDNMIIQNKEKKYLMVVKCQGINYDLMSEVEKVSVEQGFVEYLNTLRHQIQIYVQTRTVDLGKSINVYKEKVKALGNKLMQAELKYSQNEKDDILTKEELNKEKREIAKLRNLYEYGIDIVNNTEKMSLNRNILSKQYYIIIPFYAEEIGAGDYSKEEIQNMAFSELYTRAQSTISLLSVCGVVGRIMDSEEIANLLYMAYNRDEAEVYDLQKAINSRYDEMYTTAPDVFVKKIKALNNKIEKEAMQKATNAVNEVRIESENERKLKEKEREYESAVKELAKMILNQNKPIIGTKTAEKAKEKIDKQYDENGDVKEESINEKKKEHTRRGRPRKS